MPLIIPAGEWFTRIRSVRNDFRSVDITRKVRKVKEESDRVKFPAAAKTGRSWHGRPGKP